MNRHSTPLPRACALALALLLAGAAPGARAADAASSASGSVTTVSGLVYSVVREGTGAQPAASDTVRVHYRGTLLDGSEFDSSYKRGEPAEFRLDQVIPCWTEGVQRMKVGGKSKLTCPPGIAYGSRRAGPIAPNSTLNFEVELLGIAGR